MKQKTNKILPLFLVFTLTITGVFAFLSVTKSKENVFITGSINGHLYEDDWYDHNTGELLNDNGGIPNVKDDVEELVSGVEVSKTPYIVNEDINDAYAFIAVGIPAFDVSVVYGDKEAVNSIARTPLSVKVKGYLVQENIAKNAAPENILQDTWNVFKKSSKCEFPNTRTDTLSKMNGVKILNIDTDNWTVVDTIFGTPEYVCAPDGTRMCNEDGEEVQMCYNYYIYAYNTKLMGTKNYKAANDNAAPVVKVTEPDAEEENASLGYYVKYSDEVKTTPLFTGFKLVDIGAKAYACINGTSYTSFSQPSYSEYSYNGFAYNFNGNNLQEQINPLTGYTCSLSSGAILNVTFETIDENNKWVEGEIVLNDGTKFTSRKCQMTGSAVVNSASGMYSQAQYLCNKPSNGIKITQMFNKTDLMYKLTDIYYGSVQFNTGTSIVTKSLPNISIVCCSSDGSWSTSSTFLRGATMVFDTMEYKGRTYDLTASTDTNVVCVGYTAKPLYTNGFQNWFESCINLGTIIGDTVWLAG